MAQIHVHSTTETTRKRSWMMTFSDILMQLLAFFIMRLAIAPYRLGAILAHEKGTAHGEKGATEDEPKLRELQFLKFHRVDSSNAIEAELGKQFLPEREEDMSFAIKEELATLGATFGDGSYIFRISESLCDSAEAKQPSTSFMIGELLATGVPLECLEVANSRIRSEGCDKSKAEPDRSTSRLRISILQKKCDPFT